MSILDLTTLFFYYIICKLGMPRKIVSDRNICFESQFWQSLMSVLQCKVTLSSGYHPQTDGQLEWFHRSVEQVFHCLVAPSYQDWVSQLSAAEFTLNSTMYVAHGCSAFEVVFGRAPPLPLDRALYSLGQNKVAAVSDFLQSWAQCFADVLAVLQRTNKIMHRYDDSHCCDVQFAIGNLVYVSTAHFPLAAGLFRKLA